MNVAEVLKKKLDSNQTVLTEFESKELLKEIGIKIPDQKLTSSKEETITAAEEIGFPVVLKLMAEDVVHKSDTGAVKLNIKNKEDVNNAYNELMKIPSQKEKSISVQKMADEPITELIIMCSIDLIKKYSHLTMRYFLIIPFFCNIFLTIITYNS